MAVEPRAMITSVLLLSLLGCSTSKLTVPVETTVSDGVRSVEFNIMFGDEQMTVINQVVKDANADLKSRIDLDEELPRLPVEDVKCLMSVDHHCSRDMLETKKILVQALQDDCVKCTNSEKERAGRVIATMMAHDPVAWKLFLTRYGSPEQVQRILG